MNILKALPIDDTLVLDASAPRKLLASSVATAALAGAFAGEAFDSALPFGAPSCKNGHVSPRVQFG